MSDDQYSRFLLYGAERSYFTGKVRPALRAKRVCFEEILATPEAYREIKRRTGLLFIPIVVTPKDETWQDTSEILDHLEARFPEPALIPSSPLQRIVAYLLEIYADEFMLLPAMHYRWSDPASERDARGAFAAITGDVDAANAFADLMHGSITALGVIETTVPAIVEHFDELLTHMQALLSDQGFLLGAQPSLADCAMMGPMYAHLSLDLTPGQIVRERAPRVAHWVERMNHPAVDAFAGFTQDDELHQSLRSILALIGRDAVPVLLDTLRDFEAWADTRPPDTTEPPRATGFHTTRLRGVEMPRYTSSYTLWMAQRVWAAYRSLDAQSRQHVDRALAGTGCDALLAYVPRHHLGKRDFKLVFEHV